MRTDYVKVWGKDKGTTPASYIARNNTSCAETRDTEYNCLSGRLCMCECVNVWMYVYLSRRNMHYGIVNHRLYSFNCFILLHKRWTGIGRPSSFVSPVCPFVEGFSEGGMKEEKPIWPQMNGHCYNTSVVTPPSSSGGVFNDREGGKRRRHSLLGVKSPPQAIFTYSLTRPLASPFYLFPFILLSFSFAAIKQIHHVVLCKRRVRERKWN